MEKENYSFKVESNLISVQSGIEKAAAMAEIITYDYFCTDLQSVDEKTKIIKILDFPKYATISNIMFDYVLKLQNDIELLSQSIEQLEKNHAAEINSIIENHNNYVLEHIQIEP